MPDGNPNSAEAWLIRNLGDHAGSPDRSLAGLLGRCFRLSVLPVVLAIGAVVAAAMWYREEQLGLITWADRIGYPLLLAATSAGALLLKLRPASLRAVMAMVFFAYVAHLLAVYYSEMAHRWTTGEYSNYELTILALWLPLGYVGSFVFFSPRQALFASLAILAAIAWPQLVLLGVESDPIARQVAIAILISQPVYIAALWGVGMLKMHARGVHDLAQSMSVAATSDPLTGIANRRAMVQVLERLTRDQPDPERPLALMLLDVDHFKRINDTFGHAAGDEVLVTLARQANAQLRSTDLLGRWGGEEFIIAALDQTGPQALQMADRLRAELENTAFAQVGRVTVSIGVTSHVPGEPFDATVNRADEALYRAKAMGRNRAEGLFADG